MASEIDDCGIVNLSEFLSKCLKKKVLKFSLKSFTKFGDHYGSLIKGLIVETIDDDNVSCE